jgi:hypothetical protein
LGDDRSEEVGLKRLIAGLALLTSVAAFLVIAGIGLAALAIESSGERLNGALLAVGGAIACAATLVLIFARKGAFSGRGGWLGALAAALIGALPVAALGVAALTFSGLPLGSAVPRLDWLMFAAGFVLLLGALSVLAHGYLRTGEARRAAARPAKRPEPAARPRVKPRASALPHRWWLEEADRPARPPPHDVHEEEEVRVTPIELPSIGRFRQR